MSYDYQLKDVLSVSGKMKSQAVMFKWRVLNSFLCAFINFVGYCVKNLHLKCI